MATEAIIDVHPSWLNDEEFLMQRLKEIISGNQNEPYKKDEGYDWQLDGSNNWWAQIRSKKLVIAYNTERAINLKFLFLIYKLI
ncbi:hypothetical protein A2331_04750 [Candidatus Falkowbacteria bacterium RIFOXYB2_FULL_34_18]|uniref:Uncharacterized protein n=1 Tax=Candidatus Falkowbacteria bacterium RIFOXYD2_FULL_34_120 TaxID=1798007 RepID=A0A1F5TQH7_9BACT|nr:MAG: hypothetical protein A2331_04750 [Candidatus Falkowbacteria bacterium RIFOXYB2_FULL_34_18]OGF29370.1 MAG: hypothetical protein A2500_06335 [Candidatus Falkowbacteria bacterium RIFOXYC12_FULL_34_55]OGF36561.1 MAG: hypothetical protein A2466_07375 [Candidatus Falkowbacteria bacterium RIFOXYC2_FULL_34_220]OGF38793.1 MAG: hypothetical protein A2515_03485 [Candidatus Falkowbacteria bacterium RIFOXYD12_FULL_34_57]OGF41034.1 MAG: hypothetical protein A2531_03730 [Candidatus Falkowbacteria bact